MPRRLFLAIAISSLLALSLSLIPIDRWRQADMATFQPSQPIQLSEQNALDLFTMVTTHYNIKRIKWEHAAVYVDLAVKPEQHAELPFVYQDFYNLTNQVFQFTYNVNQVYFRLLEDRDVLKGSRLLVAIQSDRQTHSHHAKNLTATEQIASFVTETFSVRIDPYFYERISP